MPCRSVLFLCHYACYIQMITIKCAENWNAWTNKQHRSASTWYVLLFYLSVPSCHLEYPWRTAQCQDPTVPSALLAFFRRFYMKSLYFQLKSNYPIDKLLRIKWYNPFTAGQRLGKKFWAAGVMAKMISRSHALYNAKPKNGDKSNICATQSRPFDARRGESV